MVLAFLFALLLLSAYDLWRFYSLWGGEKARYPVIGYHRKMSMKIFPTIMPVVRKGDEIFTLDIGTMSSSIIPIGTEILCREKDGKVYFKPYALLHFPLFTTFVIAFLFYIITALTVPMHIFWVTPIIVLLPLVLDHYQIYNGFSLQFLKDRWGSTLSRGKARIPTDEYKELIKNDQVLSFDQAMLIKNKDLKIRFAAMVLLIVLAIIYALLFQFVYEAFLMEHFTDLLMRYYSNIM